MTDLTDEQLREMRKKIASVLAYTKDQERVPSFGGSDVCAIIDELLAHRASVAREAQLKAALDEYRLAVRVGVRMEGPQFLGCNLSSLKRAWEADRAALAQPAESGATERSKLPPGRHYDDPPAAPREQSAASDEVWAGAAAGQLLIDCFDSQPGIPAPYNWYEVRRKVITALRQARAEGQAQERQRCAKIAYDFISDAQRPDFDNLRSGIAAAILSQP